ncbi:choice-of-anchor K domain-containing protein [Leptothoe sp. EHU-05/26/07-4]
MVCCCPPDSGSSGQTGYVIPGQTGYVIPGQSGNIIPGQSGNIIPGQFGNITQQISSLALFVSTVGVWSNIVEAVPGSTSLTGVGTNQICWGQGNYTSQQSSYYFEGISSASVSLDGSYFVLGTFVHHNYPVYGYSIRSATLQLTVTINGVEVSFNFQFDHNETPNDGVNGTCPQTPGFGPPCPDTVSINNSRSQETVIVDGKQYALCLAGFSQNNQVGGQFVTLENQANAVQLLGQFVEIK